MSEYVIDGFKAIKIQKKHRHDFIGSAGAAEGLTEFYERGGPVTAAEWATFAELVGGLMPRAGWTTLSGSTPINKAMVSRAPSTICRARRPQRCTEEGLPQWASAAVIAAAASGRSGAVAFQSR